MRGAQQRTAVPSYWEWTKRHGAAFARPEQDLRTGRNKPIPKGRARFMPGKRHTSRHDLRMQLASDSHSRSLGFRLPSDPLEPRLQPQSRATSAVGRSRRRPSSRAADDARAKTPDGRSSERPESGGLTNFGLDYLTGSLEFDGNRSELLPPSSPFSFMRPASPLQRERPTSPERAPPTGGIYELPRWPAGPAGGLEASGTYPSIVPHDEQHPPTDERLEALATAQFGPKGKKEAAAQKNEDAKVEAQAALSIHVRHSLPTIVCLGRRSPVWLAVGAAREAAADAGEGRSAGPAAQAQARAQVRATALPHTTHRRGPTTDQGVPAAAEAAGGGGWGGGGEREGGEEPGVGER